MEQITVKLSRDASGIPHSHRYYFHSHLKSDHHSYSQRTRFIPDELLPYFEQVSAVKSKAEFKRDARASEVTTADIRRKIGKMWA